MDSQTKLELDGKIVEVLPAGKFKVELKDLGATVLCYKSGKMKMSHISVIVDDFVKVEVSPYDLNQGRIIYRYNQGAQLQAPLGEDAKPVDDKFVKDMGGKKTKAGGSNNKKPFGKFNNKYHK